MAAALLVLAACSPGSTSSPEVSARDETVRLGLPDAENHGVSLASNGNVVVASWAATKGDRTDIVAAVSHDGGRSFAEPVQVSEAGGHARVSGEQPPRVAIGSAIVVAWTSRIDGQSQVRVARSSDGGRSFQASVTPHPPGLAGPRGWVSLALNGDAVHLAWLDSRGSASDADAGGHHAHGRMRQDLFHAVLMPTGESRERVVATDVCFCCKTSVAIDTTGSAYVAWRHIYPTDFRDMAVARLADGGETFTSPVRVSEDGWQISGCPEDGPALGIGPDETVHIAWPTIVDDRAARKGIFYSVSTDGGRTFAPRVRLDIDDGQIAAHPQIVVRGSRVTAVWDESRQGRGSVRLRDFDAARPQSDVVLVSDPADDARYPTLTRSGDALVIGWTVASPGGATIRIRRIGL